MKEIPRSLRKQTISPRSQESVLKKPQWQNILTWQNNCY